MVTRRREGLEPGCQTSTPLPSLISRSTLETSSALARQSAVRTQCTLSPSYRLVLARPFHCCSCPPALRQCADVPFKLHLAVTETQTNEAGACLSPYLTSSHLPRVDQIRKMRPVLAFSWSRRKKKRVSVLLAFQAVVPLSCLGRPPKTTLAYLPVAASA